MARKFILFLFEILYKFIFKQIAFRIDAEVVHNSITGVGEFLGKVGLLEKIFAAVLSNKDKNISQKILGIKFYSPIGLSAGFDYEARLTQITPTLGFGFHSVGTITNNSYEGNPKPMLGRLPKSKSLMVNKGFKNTGARAISTKLKRMMFDIPVGISVGRTNNPNLGQAESVRDVVSAFKIFESAKVSNSYYELNISCPNLSGNVTFYEPKKLDLLLETLDKVKVKKPIFLKMPITKSNQLTLALLNVASKHKIAGVIFGNLQTNRNDPALDKKEAKKFKVGNFSGKATWQRSNELIELAYRNFKDRFVIVGCGGVFSAEDAYIKIKKGAQLVELITGMIFVGPQLIAQINLGLSDRLKTDGFKNISEAVGAGVV